MLSKKLEEYIAYKQMLAKLQGQGLYGIDSKVRELHQTIIEILNDEYFNNALITERLQKMFDNIDKVLSKKKGIDFYKDNAKIVSEDLYYWMVLNARVRLWLTNKNIKKPEWFEF